MDWGNETTKEQEIAKETTKEVEITKEKKKRSTKKSDENLRKLFDSFLESKNE